MNAMKTRWCWRKDLSEFRGLSDRERAGFLVLLEWFRLRQGYAGTATNGFTRMPPLGTHETDPADIALVTEWINESLENRLTYDQWRLATFASPNSPEGDPSADPDGDGADNRTEFLAGTLAWSGGSFPSPALSLAGPTVTLDLTLPDNRSVQVETSDNLSDWSLWDIPGNEGIPLPAGPATISGPATGPTRFFRVLLREH